MKISTTHIILYVSQQEKSREFYETLLGFSPRLNVPGMTEFELNTNCVLGLMTESGIAKIITPALPNPSEGNGIPRCELYLYIDNLEKEFKRIQELNVKIISPLESRDWGDNAFYLADNDGHVIALAEKI
jgi:uncharacterized glyoxalase superfamily protein PhnB